MSLEENKALVRRYFDEVLDGGNIDVVYELFAPDCRVQFPADAEPRVGSDAVAANLRAGRGRMASMVSQIEHMIAEGDLVAVRLRHDVRYTADVPLREFGTLPAAGKSVTWFAHPIFRVQGGKIVQEWVQRDEVGMLQQMGGPPSSSR